MPRSGENLTNESLAVTSLRIERDKLARYRDLVAREHRTVVGDLRRYIDERLAADREAREEAA